MKRRHVEISDDARTDLIELYDWISTRAGSKIALGYVERIEDHLKGFEIGSERGQLREDIRPNLRTTGFEKRVTIAFVVEETRVVILRVFYGGRNWSELL